MAVHAHEVKAGFREYGFDDAHALAVRYAVTELGIHLAGFDILVRMRLDTRLEAYRDILYVPERDGDIRNHIDFGEAVDHDVADTRFDRHAQLAFRFDVTVQIYFFRVEARFERYIKLSARSDVDAHALALNDSAHRRI